MKNLTIIRDKEAMAFSYDCLSSLNPSTVVRNEQYGRQKRISAKNFMR